MVKRADLHKPPTQTVDDFYSLVEKAHCRLQQVVEGDVTENAVEVNNVSHQLISDLRGLLGQLTDVAKEGMLAYAKKAEKQSLRFYQNGLI